MYKEFGIKEDVIELSKKIEKDLDPIFKEVEEIEEYEEKRILWVKACKNKTLDDKDENEEEEEDE